MSYTEESEIGELRERIKALEDEIKRHNSLLDAIANTVWEINRTVANGMVEDCITGFISGKTLMDYICCKNAKESSR